MAEDRVHRRSVLRAMVAGFSVICINTGCNRRGSVSSGRCAFCGMNVPADSHWRAGATLGTGAQATELVFDTPGCLHRYRLQSSTPPRVVSDPWVVEYYGEAKVQTPASEVQYVRGSNVTGPMGPDLIPVNPTKVERFRTDHGGTRVLRFEEITLQILNGG